jgi:hypothetical protein
MNILNGKKNFLQCINFKGLDQIRGNSVNNFDYFIVHNFQMDGPSFFLPGEPENLAIPLLLSRSLAGIASSNPSGLMSVSYECCVLSEISALG